MNSHSSDLFLKEKKSINLLFCAALWNVSIRKSWYLASVAANHHTALKKKRFLQAVSKALAGRKVIRKGGNFCEEQCEQVLLCPEHRCSQLMTFTYQMCSVRCAAFMLRVTQGFLFHDIATVETQPRLSGGLYLQCLSFSAGGEAVSCSITESLLDGGSRYFFFVHENTIIP